ncbi:MAG: HlyD family efflux transporter periplasmic adaptor subunit [Proteobacteria bacterium]|nr:HlyD family efflux transporter periplasmic adaptor subunit [Pseudomonadota bacterium]
MPNSKNNFPESQNPEIILFLKKILRSDSSFFWMSLIYSLAIGFLSLAAPLSVQFLINSIAFTAMLQPAFVLGLVLLILLSFWAALNALQFFITEIFQRRFFARMAAEISISLLKSKKQKPEESETVNRFFETITIQKTIPKFLTKTLYTLLQGAIGLILVSFYHPIFFIFSLSVALCLWLIWSRFYKEAIFSSFSESERKYDLVGCFEEIVQGEIPSDLRSEEKINSLTGKYLKERKKHFKSLFRQVILLLILYVVASVILLVMGSWLVLKGQLTLGQLVAAELILSVALYGFSQLGRDFENFYDLIASCQKLSKFYNFAFEKKDFEPFTNLGQIKLPNPLKALPKFILISLLLVSLILGFTPWQQTSKGLGHIIASDPNDRAQTISAPINGRIKKWYVRDGSSVKKDDKLLEIVDNDPLILERIRSERDAKKRKFDVTQIASETAKINYHRQESLFAKGLSSRRDFEEAKIEYKKLLATQESAASELAESETKLSRQENQIIYAPKDGVILKVLAGDSATAVKSGDKLATFAPNLTDPVVEIYVSGNDIPLVFEGRKVRLQFEGWPIVQFSGWPSIAIGTFGGVISSVDSSISENGKFRVIVKKADGEEWPNARFLRHGAKTQAWILLNNVSLGYEFWRQLNSFPPTFDEALKAHHDKENFEKIKH